MTLDEMLEKEKEFLRKFHFQEGELSESLEERVFSFLEKYNYAYIYKFVQDDITLYALFSDDKYWLFKNGYYLETFILHNESLARKVANFFDYKGDVKFFYSNRRDTETLKAYFLEFTRNADFVKKYLG